MFTWILPHQGAEMLSMIEDVEELFCSIVNVLGACFLSHALVRIHSALRTHSGPLFLATSPALLFIRGAPLMLNLLLLSSIAQAHPHKAPTNALPLGSRFINSKTADILDRPISITSWQVK
jgi:hypothetical protein